MRTDLIQRSRIGWFCYKGEGHIFGLASKELIDEIWLLVLLKYHEPHAVAEKVGFLQSFILDVNVFDVVRAVMSSELEC